MKNILFNDIKIFYIFIISYFPFLGIIKFSKLSTIYIFIYLLVSILSMYMLIKNKEMKIGAIEIIVYLLIILTISSGITTMNGLGSILTFITVLLQFISLRDIKWSDKNIRTFTTLALFSIPIILLMYKGNLNTNTLGQISFITLIFVTLNTYYKYRYKNISTIIFITMCLYVIFISESRTTLVVSILFTIFSLIPVRKKNSKLVYRFMYTSSIVIPLIIPKIYLYMYNNFKNIQIIDFTGKKFFSGRQNIWMEAFEQINNNMFFGVGSKVDFVSHQTLNLHNSFLTITFVYGGIWTIFYILLLIIVFEKILKKINDDKGLYICFMALISILIISAFENILVWPFTSVFIGIIISIIYSSNTRAREV